MSAEARRRLGIAVAGVALAAYAVAFAVFFDPSQVELSWGLLAVLIIASGLQALAVWLFGELFRQGVGAIGGYISSGLGFKAALVGSSVARLLPAGGAMTPVAMAWTVRPFARGTSGAAMRATALNYAGLILLTGAGFFLYSVEAPADQVVPLRVAAVVAFFIGAAVLAVATHLGALGERLPKRLRAKVGDMVDDPVDLRSHLFLWGRVAAEVAILALVLWAFGIDLSLVETMTVFGVSQIAAGIPGTPGGIGFAEAGLLGSLAFFGVDPALAVAPVLVFRVVHYWLPAGAGLVAGTSSFLKSAEATA
ncbi:MAG TPA: flippase-like domain-containing protein [Acidimicrobiia bacterium]